jgi:hypothetical protein
MKTIAQNQLAKCEFAGTFSTPSKATLQAVGSKNSKPRSTSKTLAIAKTRYVTAGQSKAFIEVIEPQSQCYSNLCFAPDLRLAISSLVENCPAVQMSTVGQLLVSRVTGEVDRKFT